MVPRHLNLHPLEQRTGQLQAQVALVPVLCPQQQMARPVLSSTSPWWKQSKRSASSSSDSLDELGGAAAAAASSGLLWFSTWTSEKRISLDESMM